MMDKNLSQQLQDLTNLISLRNFLVQARNDATLSPRPDRRNFPDLFQRWQENRNALDGNVNVLNALVMDTAHSLIKEFRSNPTTKQVAEDGDLDLEKLKEQKKVERANRKLQQAQPRSLKDIKKNQIEEK